MEIVLLIFIYLCMCAHCPIQVKSEVNSWEPRGFWASNSGHQACSQVPLPTEPSGLLPLTLQPPHSASYIPLTLQTPHSAAPLTLKHPTTHTEILLFPCVPCIGITGVCCWSWLSGAAGNNPDPPPHQLSISSGTPTPPHFSLFFLN